jgi:molybdate transport repressor ModE-like protein
VTKQNCIEPDWVDIRVFLALARHGSLSAAARALNLNYATVSRRVQSLEDALGESLVERRPDGYILTAAGSRLLEPAYRMEAAAAAFTRLNVGSGPRGLVRVNAPPSLAQTFLIQSVAALVTLYPNLDVEVASDVRPVSLERREADIVLRLSRPANGDVIARPIATFECAFYANPEWCARIEQHQESSFVGFDEQNAHLPDAQWLSRNFPRARIAFRASNHLIQAAAASAGAGFALLPNYVGALQPTLQRCSL